MSCPCIPGPVASTITWAAYESDLKAFLGDLACCVSDFQLQCWLEAATATADQVLGCTFDCDCDGVAQIPNPVICGVFSWVQSSAQATIGGTAYSGPVKSIKTGDLSVTYGGADGTTAEAASKSAAMPYWRPYICGPWR